MNFPGSATEAVPRAAAPRDMSAGEWAVRCDLAALYRVVAMFGWDDLLSTHISARVPGEEGSFLLNPFGLLFEEVTARNLVKVDENGKVVDGEGRINPAGFMIHSCVHTGRPEAVCVLHLHTADGCAVATQAAGLLPLTQHALVIHDDVAYHDFEGVVLDPGERARLLADLGDKRMMILRNHGTLTVGRTVGEAFALMYRLERACRMQVAAQKTGQPLATLPQPVIDSTALTGRRAFSEGGFLPAGQMEWAAMLRKLRTMGIDYLG